MSAKLFEPITIGGVELRNRIAMSSRYMRSATDLGSNEGGVEQTHLRRRTGSV
ncbi:hypothetical protein D9M69_668130 [compost metagenome]